MIDEKKLENITYRVVNGKFVSPNEAFEVDRLARLGLWAEKHGIPILKNYASLPEDGIKMPLGNGTTTSTLPLGYRPKDAVNAIVALPKESE